MLLERKKEILTMLQTEKMIRVSDLARALYVSEPTVRRDLAVLEKQGLVRRVFGGVTLPEGAADLEIPFVIRKEEQSAAKQLIARKAMKMVHPGDVIALDSSTTCFAMVPMLAQIPDVIVVTNGAKTAQELARLGVRTISTGGEIMAHSYMMVGRFASQTIRQMNYTKMFFSCRSVSPDGQVSEQCKETADILINFLQQSRKRYLLCDSSKIGEGSLYNVCHVKDVDEFFCDAPLPNEILEKLKNRDK